MRRYGRRTALHITNPYKNKLSKTVVVVVIVVVIVVVVIVIVTVVVVVVVLYSYNRTHRTDLKNI